MMSQDQLGELRQARCAEQLSRLLLNRDVTASEGIEEFHWDLVLSIAQQNGILLRTAAVLQERSISTSERFSGVVKAEQRRIHRTLEMTREIHEFCLRYGIEHVFLKAFQHSPDMGRDVDLLVLADRRHVDGLIRGPLQASRLGGNLASRVAGAVVYRMASSPTLLDVQFGRVGALGEHRDFATELFRRRSETSVAGCAFSTPSVEDQLVLQGIQRVYAHRYVRISDLVWTITALRRSDLQWPYIIETAKRLGILSGLSCYLAYVEQLYHAVSGADLLRTELKRDLISRSWGHIEFRNGCYRFPALRVGARLYAGKLWANLRARNWEASGRLCLIPALQAAATLPRLRRVLLPASRKARAGVAQGTLVSAGGSR